MNRPAHVHLVAVGESIHKTLPSSLNEFSATKIVLLVEEALFKERGPPKQEKIMEAIESVKKIASLLGIDVDIVRLEKIALSDIRDAVLSVYESERGANFYFNITGGTKVLSNGLFLMSIWIGATTYYVEQDGGIQVLRVPRMNMDEVARNPNYFSILDILFGFGGRAPYKTTFQQMMPRYKPIRESGIKTKRELQKGTFSKWMRDLCLWGLIEESYLGSSKREKVLTITNDGIFALKLISSLPNRSDIV